MIDKINSISFESRFHFNGYSKHTPKARPFEEFHFMPELKSQNPINKFYKAIEDLYQRSYLRLFFESFRK